MHYIWLVKKDVRTPFIYAVVLGALLLYRIVALLLSRMPSSVASLSIKQSPIPGD